MLFLALQCPYLAPTVQNGLPSDTMARLGWDLTRYLSQGLQLDEQARAWVYFVYAAVMLGAGGWLVLEGERG